MAPQSYVDVYHGGLFSEWQQMRTIRKPIIGAVAGFALGGRTNVFLFCLYTVSNAFHQQAAASWQ
jgi:enoyl-CoA hydratase